MIVGVNVKKEFNTDIISFTKVALPFGWMGNMAPYPVVYENVTYRTTEALFQCLRFASHPEIQEKIRSQVSPMQAKIVAKEQIAIIEKEGFELMGEKDVQNMRLCIDLKIAQHPQLQQQLLDTLDKVIIEDCTARPQGSGVFWGSAYQNGKWIGKNVLGNILMDKRTQLKNDLSEKSQNKSQEYTYFFNLTSPFSNFHPARVEYKDYIFISNEQFMMFGKAKCFNDSLIADRIENIHKEFSIDGNTFRSEKERMCYNLIIDFKSEKVSREEILNDKKYIDSWNCINKTIKQLGRNVKNYDDKIWSEKREKIVLFGARLKFTQNEDLKQIFLNTGDTLMCEASMYDKLSTMEPILQKLKEEFLLENKRESKIKP
jgi:ribA/ribD-fused uncharacterized protein